MHQVLKILTFLSIAAIVAESSLIAWRFQGAWWLVPIPALGAFAAFTFNVTGASSDVLIIEWSRVTIRSIFDSFAYSVAATTVCFAVAASGAQFLMNIWHRPKELSELNLVLYRNGEKESELISGGTAFAKNIVSQKMHAPVPIDKGVARFKFVRGSVISPWVEVGWRGSQQRAYIPSIELNLPELAKRIVLNELPKDAWESADEKAHVEAGVVKVSGVPTKPSRIIGNKLWAKLYAPWGVPVSEVLIFKPHFAIGFNPQTKIPRWVANRVVTSADPSGRIVRAWKVDPSIESTVQASMHDYLGSGFDRGGLISPTDLSAYDISLRQETYYFTVITPQTAELNRRRWLRLERATRDLVNTNSDVFVISGTAFLDSSGHPAAQARSIGKSRVAVPTHFFRIIVQSHRSDRRVWAFMMPNDDSKGLNLAEMQVSIAKVERATGLTFFPDADPEELSSLKTPQILPFPQQ